MGAEKIQCTLILKKPLWWLQVFQSFKIGSLTDKQLDHLVKESIKAHGILIPLTLYVYKSQGLNNLISPNNLSFNFPSAASHCALILKKKKSLQVFDLSSQVAPKTNSWTIYKNSSEVYGVPTHLAQQQDPWNRLNSKHTLTSSRHEVYHFDPQAPNDSLDFVLKSTYSQHEEFLKNKNETLFQRETFDEDHAGWVLSLSC